MNYMKQVRTSQPQSSIPIREEIDSLLTPVFGGSVGLTNGNWIAVKGNSWSCPFYLNASSSVCQSGKSVLSNGSGHVERTRTMTGGLTIAFVFVPTSSGTYGIWSIGSTNGDGSPQILIQQSGADLQVYCSGGYQLLFSSVLTIGKECRVAISIDNLAATGSSLRFAVNGAVKEFAGGIRATGESTEYFGNGYPGGMPGHYVLYWSTPKFCSVAELVSFTRNPWQIFTPIKKLIFTSIPVGAVPQLLAPISDLSSGGWTPSTGGTLYGCIDETIADASDYIISSSATSCEVGLAVGTDPLASTGHILRYELLSGTGSITVTLKQGATTIASFGPHSLTGATQDFTQTLSGGQADSITNYGALSVVFTAS